MTVNQALDILQSAVDRCRRDEILTIEVYGALASLESYSGNARPTAKFRSALERPRRTARQKEARWQELNAALYRIRREVQDRKS
jgi:hypothetical protein